MTTYPPTSAPGQELSQIPILTLGGAGETRPSFCPGTGQSASPASEVNPIPETNTNKSKQKLPLKQAKLLSRARAESRSSRKKGRSAVDPRFGLDSAHGASRRGSREAEGAIAQAEGAALVVALRHGAGALGHTSHSACDSGAVAGEGLDDGAGSACVDEGTSGACVDESDVPDEGGGGVDEGSDGGVGG